jgi:hypothetical protein
VFNNTAANENQSQCDIQNYKNLFGKCEVLCSLSFFYYFPSLTSDVTFDNSGKHALELSDDMPKNYNYLS